MAKLDPSVLDNPNVRQILNIIATTEGTDTTGSGGGYDIAFGGGKLASLDAHPRKYYAFTQTDGTKNQTSAAGRYQFLAKTWDDVSRQLGLKDFSARSQDLAAVELIRRAGMLDKVKNGDLNGALAGLGKTWASLPSSPYPQPKVSERTVANLLRKSPIDPRPDFSLAMPNQPDVQNPKMNEYLLRTLEDEIGAQQTANASDFSSMAATLPQQDMFQQVVNFDSPLFGPPPRDKLVNEANKIWDQTEVKRTV